MGSFSPDQAINSGYWEPLSSQSAWSRPPFATRLEKMRIHISCCCCSVTKSCLTPWTIARQAPLSMGFPRQEYWSELPFPPPGDLSDLGIEPTSPTLTGGFFTTESLGKPKELFPRLKRPTQNLRENPAGGQELQCDPADLSHSTPSSPYRNPFSSQATLLTPRPHLRSPNPCTSAPSV